MLTYLIILLLIVIVTAIIVVYNTLIRSRNKMREAWSIIDVYLRKRHDLVPALVHIAEGYSILEQNLLAEISVYRADAISAKDINHQILCEMKLDKAIADIRVLYESYPDLKANNSFLKLQYQISQIENDLEKVRRYYNGCVREYNTNLQTFPLNLVAYISGFKPALYYRKDTINE